MIREELDISELISHFPWQQISVDRGFVMGYPEVMMVSDYMQTLFTQVSALLHNLSWEPDNTVEIVISEIDSTIPTDQIEINVSLGTVSEVWEIIDFPTEKLAEYLRLATIDYLSTQRYKSEQAQFARLSTTTWMVIGINRENSLNL